MFHDSPSLGNVRRSARTRDRPVARRRVHVVAELLRPPGRPAGGSRAAAEVVDVCTARSRLEREQAGLLRQRRVGLRVAEPRVRADRIERVGSSSWWQPSTPCSRACSVSRPGVRRRRRVGAVDLARRSRRSAPGSSVTRSGCSRWSASSRRTPASRRSRAAASTARARSPCAAPAGRRTCVVASPPTGRRIVTIVHAVKSVAANCTLVGEPARLPQLPLGPGWFGISPNSIWRTAGCRAVERDGIEPVARRIRVLETRQVRRVPVHVVRARRVDASVDRDRTLPRSRA